MGYKEIFLSPKLNSSVKHSHLNENMAHQRGLFSLAVISPKSIQEMVSVENYLLVTVVGLIEFCRPE
jgi:hypothetical protein